MTEDSKRQAYSRICSNRQMHRSTHSWLSGPRLSLRARTSFTTHASIDSQLEPAACRGESAERVTAIANYVGKFLNLAEGEGFEPPVPFRVQWFSRPPPSTTRPSLRGGTSSGHSSGFAFHRDRGVWYVSHAHQDQSPAADHSQDSRELVFLRCLQAAVSQARAKRPALYVLTLPPFEVVDEAPPGE